MRKYKLQAALSGLMVSSCAIAGCEVATKQDALEASPKPPVEISFWNPFGGGEGDYVEQIIKGFNDSQDDVTVRQLRLESNEYYVRLSTALSFGKGPDVAVAHVDRMSPFVKAKQIQPLDELAREAGFQFDNLTEASRQSVNFDGKPYGVPLDTHFHVLYYNKDLLAKADLLGDDGTPLLHDLTPQRFIDLLQQIKTRVPGIQPLAINTPYFQEPFLDMYYEAGGELLTPDLMHAAINNDNARRVLTFFQQLYTDGLSDLNDQTPWDSFHNGQAALWFGGNWEAGHHLENPSLRIGIAPLPAIFGSEAHWGSAHALVIPSYVPKEKLLAAMSFIRYFSEVGSQKWGEAGHVPVNRTVRGSDAYRMLPYRDQFLKAEQQVKFAPQTDKYAALYTALSEELQNIIFNHLNPAEGLNELERKLNELLAN
ncbi:ABC transporter substrate-binding protein [Paenibacillus aurantiacus]|uniref:ABC transporter substrate-binding protein n=1 Tax=Paenibacillus aurantiacus TaxID=1936118 RepID=A0ABV5KU44_9BACL